MTFWWFGCREGHALEDSCYESSGEGSLKPPLMLGTSNGQDDHGKKDLSTFAQVHTGVCTLSGQNTFKVTSEKLN